MKRKIISASRRTDIPAFYSEWFMNRVRAGYCVYPNPLYPKQFYKVDLRRSAVQGIVFWTRHAAPLLPHLAILKDQGYPFYFQYTILGYPRSLDLRSPSRDVAIRTFRTLSDIVGSERIIWRYDPIILKPDITLEWHRQNFLEIAASLEGATTRVVVSVVDPYLKTKRRVGREEDGVVYAPEAYLELLQWMAHTARKHGLASESCAEGTIQVPGLVQGNCVDAYLLAEIARENLARMPKPHRQRDACLCHVSVDIGVNETCGFGCPYCYATASDARALVKLRRHDPTWNSIIGNYEVAEPMLEPEQPTLF